MNQEDPVRCPCGRLLRDETSRALRMGPVCRKRLRGPHSPSIRAAPAPVIPGQLAIPIQPPLTTRSTT